jgi:hypothetical protein
VEYNHKPGTLEWLLGLEQPAEECPLPVRGGDGGTASVCGGVTHPRMVLRAESRFRHWMFSRMVERKPSPTGQCCSNHCTTTWLLSHR